jgi:PAS domain S-box-containing protein
MKLADQLLVIGAVNRVTKINGDPWCTSKEIKELSGLREGKVDSLLDDLINRGWIEQYKEGYRQSIWINSHDCFVSIMENSGEAIFVVQDYKIKFITKEMAKLVGYSPEEFMSRDFMEFIHSDDLPAMSARHADRLEGKKVESSFSLRVVDKDSLVKRVTIDVSDLASWKDKPAVLTFVRDVKEEKENYMIAGALFFLSSISIGLVGLESVGYLV